jgi:hypothetical protein
LASPAWHACRAKPRFAQEVKVLISCTTWRKLAFAVYFSTDLIIVADGSAAAGAFEMRG